MRSGEGSHLSASFDPWGLTASRLPGSNVSGSSTVGGTVKVVIDADLCQGQGRCFSIAPGVFDFDELGNGVVRGDGTLTPETLDLARLAQANCPEHAIFIEESL